MDDTALNQSALSIARDCGSTEATKRTPSFDSFVGNTIGGKKQVVQVPGAGKYWGGRTIAASFNPEPAATASTHAPRRRRRLWVKVKRPQEQVTPANALEVEITLRVLPGTQGAL
jgi:hypothetical protein